MTEGGSGRTPLTPEEEQVARLLAEAGGPVPMPAPVADRLDGVIAELQAERAADPGASSADVVELRARRRWPRVLLAAAAVVIGGYAVGTVASEGTLSGSGEDATAASDSAGGSTSESLERGADEEQTGEPGALAEGGVSAQEAPAGSAAPEAAEDRARMTFTVVRLRSDRLEAGVLRALRVLDSPADAPLDLAPTEEGCRLPETSGGERTLAVRYDGTAAVLVAGPERGGSVQVTVYDCSGAVLDVTLVRP